VRRVLLIAAMLVCVALLAACGSTSGQIPERYANISTDLYNRDCAAAAGHVATAQSDLTTLPATVDARLGRNLSDGLTTLAGLVHKDCQSSSNNTGNTGTTSTTGTTGATSTTGTTGTTSSTSTTGTTGTTTTTSTTSSAATTTSETTSAATTETSVATTTSEPGNGGTPGDGNGNGNGNNGLGNGGVSSGGNQ
jgi:hypothetical protein